MLCSWDGNGSLLMSWTKCIFELIDWRSWIWNCLYFLLTDDVLVPYICPVKCFNMPTYKEGLLGTVFIELIMFAFFAADGVTYILVRVCHSCLLWNVQKKKFYYSQIVCQLATALLTWLVCCVLSLCVVCISKLLLNKQVKCVSCWKNQQKTTVVLAVLCFTRASLKNFNLVINTMRQICWNQLGSRETTEDHVRDCPTSWNHRVEQCPSFSTAVIVPTSRLHTFVVEDQLGRDEEDRSQVVECRESSTTRRCERQWRGCVIGIGFTVPQDYQLGCRASRLEKYSTVMPVSHPHVT